MHVLLGFIALATINAVGDNIAVSTITAQLPCVYMTGCTMRDRRIGMEPATRSHNP
jgi:hypothetical protein